MRRIVGVTTIYNDDIGSSPRCAACILTTSPSPERPGAPTTGDLGEGSRRVNLQVIRAKRSRRSRPTRRCRPTWTPAPWRSDNLVPVSAFAAPAQVLIATGGVSTRPIWTCPDINSAGDSKESPYGALPTLWARRFGDAEQFGAVMSGFWQMRPRTRTNFATGAASISTRRHGHDAGAADWTASRRPASSPSTTTPTSSASTAARPG